MYTFFRQLHLFSGLVLLVFIVLYFGTGYVMIHPEWFGDEGPETARQDVALGIPAGLDDDGLSRFLQDRFGLRGKRLPARHHDDGSLLFAYYHPGTFSEVTVAADRRTVTLATHTESWQRVVHGLHRLHGYGGGWAYVLYAFCMDLASVALIVFALTGVYLWHRLTKPRRRWIGWTLLALTWAYTLATIAYLLAAP
jgi:hypothetical protein